MKRKSGFLLCIVLLFCVLTATGVDQEFDYQISDNMNASAGTNMREHVAGSNDCFLSAVAAGRVSNFHATEDARGSVSWALWHAYLQIAWGGPDTMIGPLEMVYDGVDYKVQTNPVSKSHEGAIDCQSDGEIVPISESVSAFADSVIYAGQ